MVLLQRKRAVNEKLRLKKGHLTGNKLITIYEIWWYDHRGNALPTRDLDPKSAISLATYQRWSTKAGDTTTKETCFQRETEIEERVCHWWWTTDDLRKPMTLPPMKRAFNERAVLKKDHLAGNNDWEFELELVVQAQSWAHFQRETDFEENIVSLVAIEDDCTRVDGTVARNDLFAPARNRYQRMTISPTSSILATNMAADSTSLSRQDVINLTAMGHAEIVFDDQHISLAGLGISAAHRAWMGSMSISVSAIFDVVDVWFRELYSFA
jgi:hypothetical protein